MECDILPGQRPTVRAQRFRLVAGAAPHMNLRLTALERSIRPLAPKPASFLPGSFTLWPLTIFPVIRACDCSPQGTLLAFPAGGNSHANNAAKDWLCTSRRRADGDRRDQHGGGGAEPGRAADVLQHLPAERRSQ